MYICYIFHLSDWTSTVRLLLVRIQFLVVPGHRTTINVKPWSERRFESDADLSQYHIYSLLMFILQTHKISCVVIVFISVFIFSYKSSIFQLVSSTK